MGLRIVVWYCMVWCIAAMFHSLSLLLVLLVLLLGYTNGQRRIAQLNTLIGRILAVLSVTQSSVCAEAQLQLRLLCYSDYEEQSC